MVNSTVFLTWLDPAGNCPVQRKRFLGCVTRYDLPKGVPIALTSEDANLIANQAQSENVERVKAGQQPAYEIEQRKGGAGLDFRDVQLDPTIPWASGHEPPQAAEKPAKGKK